MKFEYIRSIDYELFNKIEKYCHLISVKELDDYYEKRSIDEFLPMVSSKNPQEVIMNAVNAYVSVITLNNLKGLSGDALRVYYGKSSKDTLNGKFDYNTQESLKMRLDFYDLISSEVSKYLLHLYIRAVIKNSV